MSSVSLWSPPRECLAGAEQERARLEQQRVAEENNRRAAEERKAQLEQAGAKQRHDYGAGMNIMMRYKGINGINAFATNWDGHADPPATLEDYKQQEPGNNRLLVMWADEGTVSAEQLATVFTNSPQAGNDGIQSMGFNEVQFIDPASYCYASVNPLLGVSGVKCQMRLASR